MARAKSDFPTKAKYRAKRTEIDGIKFDSKKESKRYIELKLMKKAGVITDFSLQPKFEVFPGYRNREGKKIQPIHYVADFKVVYPDGRVEYEDTKGVITKEFAIKKKLFEYRYPELILKVF